MKFGSLHDRAVVRLDAEERTVGGIITLDTAKMIKNYVIKIIGGFL